MNSKFVCVLVFTFLAVQVSAWSVVIPETQDTQSDFVKGLAKLGAELTKLLSEVLDKVSELATNADNNLSEIEAKVSEFIAKAVSAINELFLKELDILNETADDTGKKLITCMKNEESTVESLLNSTVTTLITCTTKNIPDLLAGGKVLIDDVSAAVKKLTTSLENLEACTSQAALCALQFVNEASTIVKDLGATVKNDDGKLVEYLKELPSVVMTCATDSLTTVRENHAKAFNDITKCLAA